MDNKKRTLNLIIGLLYAILGFVIPFFALSMVFILIFPIIHASYIFGDILYSSAIFLLIIVLNLLVVYNSTKYASNFLIHRYRELNKSYVIGSASLFIGILIFIPSVIRGFSISYALLFALSAIPFYFTSRVYLR